MPRAGMGEQFSALGAEKEEGGHIVGAREASPVNWRLQLTVEDINREVTEGYEPVMESNLA